MLRPRTAQLVEQTESVQAWEQQVEHDELVRLGERQAQPGGSVVCRVDREPLRLEPQPQELEDARLVLDDQDSHARPGRAYSLGRGAVNATAVSLAGQAAIRSRLADRLGRPERPQVVPRAWRRSWRTPWAWRNTIP